MSNTDKPGIAVADFLRQESREGRGPWQGTTNTCRSCERPTVEHLEDGECWQCRHPGEDSTTPEERRAARRALFATTAAFLRKAGYPDRAVWYEERLREGSI
jgi:hypothetical protein